MAKNSEIPKSAEAYSELYYENNSKVTQIKLEFPYCIATENTSVFTEIATKIKDKKISIVCTYDQVNLAGIFLLNL